MMKMLKRNKIEGEKRRKEEKEKVLLFRLFFLALILSLVLSNFGCQPNQTVLKDVAPPTPMETVELKKTTFEEDLREMETADFDYILVFRRKDGGIFDKDDQKYLRENTPLETNRWRKTEEGKAFIAGSGFSFTPEQMTALRNRFIVEDYSKPEIKKANEANQNTKPEANSNKANINKSNTNKANINKSNTNK